MVSVRVRVWLKVTSMQLIVIITVDQTLQTHIHRPFGRKHQTDEHRQIV